ncbi:hypothetical protein ACLOJK_032854 [Asimina triloba]
MAGTLIYWLLRWEISPSRSAVENLSRIVTLMVMVMRGKEVEDPRQLAFPMGPEGCRVLVVDDDPICLRVTSTSTYIRSIITMFGSGRGTSEAVALSVLREKKDKFDLILTDVHMPDMDGFKLLELVGLDLDLPVISKYPAATI